MNLITIITLFSESDIFIFPISIALSYFLVKTQTVGLQPYKQKYLLTAFWAKVVIILVYALITEFYFDGGDTFRYYQSTLDGRAGIKDGVVDFFYFLRASKLDINDPIAYYYDTDPLGDNLPYMLNHNNFLVARVGTYLSYPTFKSYLGIGMLFSMYALIGCWRIFLTLDDLYPKLHRELALVCLFIPSVIYWSSGIMKDPLSIGGIGFMMYGAYNIFIKKKAILSSLFWILLSGYLVYYSKVYIFMAFVPSLAIWLYTMTSRNIKNVKLRRVSVFFLSLFAIVAVYFIMQYLNSIEGATDYQLSTLTEQIEQAQGAWAANQGAGSNYTLPTGNPVIVFLAGLGTSYFRPFLWEARNPVMLFSALESLAVLLLFLYTFKKVGIVRTFKTIFSSPTTIFTFIFSIIFGGLVGMSTANFGSLVRYKIPGLPFFLITFILVIYLAEKPFPRWFTRLLPGKDSEERKAANRSHQLKPA